MGLFLGCMKRAFQNHPAPSPFALHPGGLRGEGAAKPCADLCRPEVCSTDSSNLTRYEQTTNLMNGAILANRGEILSGVATRS